MAGLSKAYQAKEYEEKIYRLWEKSGYFNPDKLKTKKKKTYTIVLPPPNITGELHLGHALNAFLQDIIIRWRRMQGYRTLWLPGTDHAGIATQNVVEKQLKKEGLTRFDLGREKFIERIWAWQKKYGHLILEQLKKLGASCDWSRTKFTLDKDYQEAVLYAFAYYYKKGWIYQGERLVNWCPRCQTSLSDLELEYQEKKGKLWYIKYNLTNLKSQNSKFIIVATTRPETMLGDTAVAVHPQDKRYKHLIGQKVILPLVGREIPIIGDKAVDPDFGTGAVKVTPAHDPVDFEIAQRHHLPMIKILNEKGYLNENVPQRYQNLPVLEAREKVVQDLEKEGYLVKIEDYSHRVAHCYRCGTVIEPFLSQQWFLKMDKLAEKALKVVRKKEIKFHPDRFKKIYFDWLENIKDWCISRQIWWGHRLPIWQCKNPNFKSQIPNQESRITNSKSQIQNSKFKIQEGYFLSLKPPRKCPVCGQCRPEQVPDVLDTWFSSALWPFATLGWPKKTKDLKNFYPTQSLFTARDIINLWVARMIFSGLELLKKKPFSDVYIHATILTKEGQRMSKSLGTGVNPLDLVEKYGADGVRFGLIYQALGGQDIRFLEENLAMGQRFCNKIWNASRFVLGYLNINSKLKTQNSKLQIKIQKEKLTKADRKILRQLALTTKKVTRDLENFRFGQAAHTLYHFFWHNFCDEYIETAKKQNPAQTANVLIYVLTNSLKLLHPFVPFVTEAIYQHLPWRKKKFLMIEDWPK